MRVINFSIRVYLLDLFVLVVCRCNKVFLKVHFHFIFFTRHWIGTEHDLVLCCRVVPHFYVTEQVRVPTQVGKIAKKTV